MRARFLPSTSTFTVPSGRRNSCKMVPSVPISKMSSGAGSLVFAFFCAARRMSLSCAIASSSAAMDFSRPTNSGTTMCGKTMMSRSGSRGTVRTPPLALGSFFSSLRKNIGCLASGGSTGRLGHAKRTASVRRSHSIILLHTQRVRRGPEFPSALDGTQVRASARYRMLGERTAGLRGLGLLLVHDEGRFLLENAVLVEHDLADVLVRGHFVHHVQHRVLEDGPEPARAALVTDGLLRHRPQRAFGELELDAVHLHQLPVLFGERVARLGEDVHQRRLVELLERRDHRQAPDELRDHAELQEVLGLRVAEQLADVPLLLRLHVGAEPQALALRALGDDVLQPAERAAADEEDVRGVDLEELLLRVLAAAFGRHVRDGALDDLEQRLLHAFAGDVARDRRVLALARDLVDLVDVDDPLLRALDVVVRRLQEVDDDVLDVLADVSRLGEAGRVRDGEGDVEDARQRLRQQRLAGAGRAEQQDVRLLQLDVVHRDLALDPLVVVVDRDREDLLRALLSDHVLVEDALDLGRPGDAQLLIARLLLVDLLRDDVVAEPDALVADIDGRS